MSAIDVQAVTGKVGLPAPVSELASRDWDAIVVGGGHNGLTAAAYLARSGRAVLVLVLERRERLGGACTLERPGYRVFLADPNLWCPFPDGTSLGQFLDDARTAEHMRANGFSEADLRSILAYEEAFDRLRRLLRHGPLGDTWSRPSPTRAELEELLGGDEEMISILAICSATGRSGATSREAWAASPSRSRRRPSTLAPAGRRASRSLASSPARASRSRAAS